MNKTVMTINIITIFPDFFKSSISFSILKRAQEKGLIKFNIYNLRDWSKDNYKTIDGHPYGGGPGMVMMLPPIYDALKSLNFPKNIVVPSAKGKKWNQKLAQEFSEFDEITFIVPHFEGIDQRVLDNFTDYEISVGEYILSGGELPTMTIIDTIVRLIPNALGNPDSLLEETFNDINTNIEVLQYKDNLTLKDFKEYPQYTRPKEFVTDEGKTLSVPEVLVNGNHKEIQNWKDNN